MNENTENQEKQEDKKPDEFGGFYFSSSVKIFDPETKEILVQKRGDD
jgi:hypothetical protein